MTMLTALNRLAEIARNDGQPERSAELERPRAEIDRLNARYRKLSMSLALFFRGCGLGTALRDFRNSLRFILSRLTGYTGATRWRSGRCRRLTATGKLG
jgi:hypothetical protein